MFLVDKQIRQAIAQKRIIIEPFEKDRIAPGAYYFRLGNLLLKPESNTTVDLRKSINIKYEEFDLSSNEYVLHPGEFILGQTLEFITVSNDLSIFLDGRTTNARLGLTVHQTASFIHPGHTNSIITLELCNLGVHEIVLYSGMEIAKGVFLKASDKASNGYANCDGKVYGCGAYGVQKQTMGIKIDNR